ncbi:MAG: hypothetical protein ACP5RQ_00640 [Candidatus Micrarchaeia archaeon]
MLKINLKKHLDLIFLFTISTLVIIVTFGFFTLFILPIIIFVLFLLIYLIELIEFNKNKQRENKKLISLLKMLYLDLKAGKPISNSINDLIKKTEKLDVNSIFYDTLKKYNIYKNLGYFKNSDYSNADNKSYNKKFNNNTNNENNYSVITDINNINEDALINLIFNSVYNNNISSIKNFYKKINYEIKLLSEKKQSALNKYLIINMLFNSIIPSLLIFGFISYSIFSNFQDVIFPFSLLLLVILPAISILINAKISEIDV